jgi:CubicO group peptidase (beta-lactamase class C family)
MGAGSIASPLTDMVKWEAALHGNSFLTPESRRAIWSQFKFNSGENSPYGFGWRISDIRGHKLIGHTGQTAGFGSAIFRYVENGVTVIVLTNLGESGMGSLIASSVAKLYIPSISLKNISLEKSPDQEMKTKFRIALNKRIKNIVDDEVFSAAFARSQASERAKRLNERIVSFGDITAFQAVDSENLDGRTTYRYLAKTKTVLMLWRFTMDGDGKITEMVLEEDE